MMDPTMDFQVGPSVASAIYITDNHGPSLIAVAKYQFSILESLVLTFGYNSLRFVWLGFMAYQPL